MSITKASDVTTRIVLCFTTDRGHEFEVFPATTDEATAMRRAARAVATLSRIARWPGRFVACRVVVEKISTAATIPVPTPTRRKNLAGLAGRR